MEAGSDPSPRGRIALENSTATTMQVCTVLGGVSLTLFLVFLVTFLLNPNRSNAGSE
jgi:hypothetical protein